MSTIYATREEWLSKLASVMVDRLFKPLGISFTEQHRVTCGWTMKRKAIGECYSPEASSAGYREIFISPVLSDVVEVAATLAHELCHAALPFGVAHKRPFAKMARSIGLIGKPTHTSAGGEFMAWWRDVASELGDYPHAAMNRAMMGKKQTTRLIKVHCPACADGGEPYLVRMSAKTIDMGLPVCPIHESPMKI